MAIWSVLRALSPPQRSAVLASFLGWTLDAFDFFLLVFLLHAIAQAFATDVAAVALAITFTLAMRPLGALLFGHAADRWGRRPVLMANIALFAALEFASGLAPSLGVLIVLRAAFGIAMGGEWGVGASLAMETIPPRARGVVSGILQAGYPTGYLLAALAYGLLSEVLGWRGLLMAGALPALLVLYIRSRVIESPVYAAQSRTPRPGLIATVRANGRLFLVAFAMMTAFNFLAHGTQDLYPTFLEVQRGLERPTVSLLAIIGSIGAILGSITFGTLSEHIGRRRAIVAGALLVLPVIPLWAFSTAPVMLAAGAFLIQVAVQGAYGVVPAHLNELSPDSVRGTFPGFVYQLSNLVAAANVTLQAGLAEAYGNNYALALATVGGLSAVLVAVFAGFGPEHRGVLFGAAEARPRS